MLLRNVLFLIVVVVVVVVAASSFVTCRGINVVLGDLLVIAHVLFFALGIKAVVMIPDVTASYRQIPPPSARSKAC